MKHYAPLLAGLTLGLFEQPLSARESLVLDELSITDVFVEEPPAPGSLASHPRVIATSHIGGLTDESVSKATAIAVENLLAALVREDAA